MSGYNYLNIPTVQSNKFFISKNDNGEVKPPSEQLTVDDLHNEIDTREFEKYKIHEQILEKCHNQIKNVNKKSNCKYTIFKIPIIQFGVPVYDVIQCAIFIMEDLIKRGFKVQFQNPNILVISWFIRNKNSNNEYKQYINNQNNNKQNNNKQINYHPTDIKTLEYKTKHMFN